MKSEFFYKLYGLTLSSNRPINLLLSVPPVTQIDLQACFHDVKKPLSTPEQKFCIFTSDGYAENKLPFLQIWKQPKRPDQYLVFQYTDGKNFSLFKYNHTTNCLNIYSTPELRFLDILSFLTGPVFGAILRLKNITCLHASVVAVKDRAIAIIGPKGAGKSTLVAELAAQGFAVLSDDLAPLYLNKGVFYIHPGYPMIRLWPNSIKQYSSLSFNSLPRVLSFTEKRFVPLSLNNGIKQWHFQTHPLPLHSVYLLGDRTTEKEHKLQCLQQSNSFFSLTQNVYAEYLLEQSSRSSDFLLLGKLASSVSLWQVKRPNCLSSVTDLCRILEKAV